MWNIALFGPPWSWIQTNCWCLCYSWKVLQLLFQSQHHPFLLLLLAASFFRLLTAITAWRPHPKTFNIWKLWYWSQPSWIPPCFPPTEACLEYGVHEKPFVLMLEWSVILLFFNLYKNLIQHKVFHLVIVACHLCFHADVFDIWYLYELLCRQVEHKSGKRAIVLRGLDMMAQHIKSRKLSLLPWMLKNFPLA